MAGTVPTIAASRARIDAAIDALRDPRDRAMLTLYRDHWWAEVYNRVDAIMATLTDDRVDYLFDGVNIFFADSFAFTAVADARALYAGAAGSGLPMAGPFEDERFAFADWGMVFEGVLSSIVPGAVLRHLPAPPPADALMLVTWRTVSTHPIDVAANRMIGEHVYSGAVLRLEPADDATVRAMYGEEVLAALAG